jgi:prolipoprotein diacylglyceryltransferase
MLPVLNIGPLAIQLPGLLLLLSLWLGLTLAEKTVHHHKMTTNDLYNLVFTILIGAVISARLVFVANYPSAFIKSPWSIFSLSPELLDSWGGIGGGFLAGILFMQRRKLHLLPTLDALVPALAVLAIFIALADYASGNAFGSPTKVPWGIELWGAVRHPTQIYQAIAATIILVLIKSKQDLFIGLPDGVYFLVFLAASAASQLFLEYFRGDSILLPGGFREPQVVAWLILASCLWWLQKLIKQKTIEEN